MATVRYSQIEAVLVPLNIMCYNCVVTNLMKMYYFSKVIFLQM